jgi:hypothetical protein
VVLLIRLNLPTTTRASFPSLSSPSLAVEQTHTRSLCKRGHSTRSTAEMLATALFSVLLALAPLAASAPVPIVLVDDLELPLPAALRHSPPATTHFRPLPQGVRLLPEDDDETAQEPIDNRPVTPASTVHPSVALASPQPVATTYLLGLARSRPADQQQGSPEALNDAGRRRRVGMPCYYMRHHARGRGEYTDVLAIGLVATFLLVIVVVETWEGVRER